MSAAQHPVEVESVVLLDVHLDVSADVVDEPSPIGAIVAIQSAPGHLLNPIHRSCVSGHKPHKPSCDATSTRRICMRSLAYLLK